MSVPYVLSNLFFRIYSDLTEKDFKELETNIDYNELEDVLRNYLISTMTYKNSFMENMKEVEIAFENIITNANKYKMDLISLIKNYGSDYVKLLDSHPYTCYFIESINSLCSEKFDVKRVEDDPTNIEGINVAIKHNDKRFEIIRIMRQDEEQLPSMKIENIDDFENILSNYIESIKSGNTFYNIFAREGFYEKTEKEKIKMIMEGAILNVTNQDSQNLEMFFKRYTDFVNNKTFSEITHPVYTGELFKDSLFTMAKRSELWYETPYYLAFMLANSRVELPNVRLGVSEEDGKKVAHIIATQTAQTQNNMERLAEINKEIKESMPSESYFRFYNPSHLVSLVITFGLLKGMGINEVIIKDYMPFRYKKVIMDKQLNEEEAENYQTRLTTKNLATYMRIVSNIEGIDILSYPDVDSELKLIIKDDVKGKNDFLTNLYNIGLNLGEQYKKDDEQKIY